jgi:hypothetical protein
MDKDGFKKLIENIYNYYQKDGYAAKAPSSQQMNLWYDEVKYIPIEAVDFISKYIFRERDAIPKNLPKAIKEGYGNYPRSTSFVKYDDIEDSRFPVNKLWDGLMILRTKGIDKFLQFANFEKMPRNDRDRVITKHKVMEGQIKLDLDKLKDAVGVRINPKQSRPEIQHYDDEVPF